MKIVFEDTKLIALATDEYNGENAIAAPEWFTADDLGKYELIDGELVAIKPTSITPRQARIVLALQPSPETQPEDWDEEANGAWEPTFPHMLAYVEDAFTQLPEPDKTVASITWEYATEVLRTDPLVAQMAQVIGLTDEQVDQMFMEASEL